MDRRPTAAKPTPMSTSCEDIQNQAKRMGSCEYVQCVISEDLFEQAYSSAGIEVAEIQDRVAKIGQP